MEAGSGKPLFRQDVKAYVFSSPAVAGEVLYLGILNGSLEARDLSTGKLLWDFRTEASRRNPGWVLTADRKFNEPMIFFHSFWREDAAVGTERQFAVGSIFSSPLIVDGVVYAGSADGSVYALN